MVLLPQNTLVDNILRSCHILFYRKNLFHSIQCWRNRINFCEHKNPLRDKKQEYEKIFNISATKVILTFFLRAIPDDISQNSFKVSSVVVRAFARFVSLCICVRL